MKDLLLLSGSFSPKGSSTKERLALVTYSHFFLLASYPQSRPDDLFVFAYLPFKREVLHVDLFIICVPIF